MQKSGIADLIPGTVIDDVLFVPCGYSMNGLLPDVRKLGLMSVYFSVEHSSIAMLFINNVPVILESGAPLLDPSLNVS